MFKNYILHWTLKILFFVPFISHSVAAQYSRMGLETENIYQGHYQRLSSGYDHTLEIKNGLIHAYGANDFGQLGIDSQLDNKLQDLDHVVLVAAGNQFSIALRADGTLWSWGKNNSGQLGLPHLNNTNIPAQIGTDEDWVSIDAGESHILALKVDGSLWSWGSNEYKQLGRILQDNATFTNIPQPITDSNKWVQIQAGKNFSLGLTPTGSVFQWGTLTDDSTAAEIPFQQYVSNHVKQISAGSNFGLALQYDGTLWGWGANSGDVLLTHTAEEVEFPVQVTTHRFKQIASGANFVTGLKSNGTIWQWGQQNTTLPPQDAEVKPGSGYVQIANGAQTAFGIKSNGQLFAWGLNTNGSLGLKSNLNFLEHPTYNSSTSKEVMSVFGNHGFGSYQLNSDGKLMGWGDNVDQILLTEGDEIAIPISLDAAGSSNINATVGYHHFLTIKDDGSIQGWGNNRHSGQVGTGSVVDENIPTTIDGNEWVKVYTGAFSSAAIKEDGTLWMWGNAVYGPMNQGDRNVTRIPTQIEDQLWKTIAVGSHHSIGIQQDGTLWGWGNNVSGEAGGNAMEEYIDTPQKIDESTDWIYVHTLGSTSYALKADGSLWGFGDGSSGQLGQPLEEHRNYNQQYGLIEIANNGFITAKVNNWSGMALKANGQIYGWGYYNDLFGDLGSDDTEVRITPKKIDNQKNVYQIGTGQTHRLLINAAKRFACTAGGNYKGELGIGDLNVSTSNTFNCELTPYLPPYQIIIATINNIAAEITTPSGQLQLTSLSNPYNSNLIVHWEIVSGNAYASINTTGLLQAISDGWVMVRATDSTDATNYAELYVEIKNNLNIESPSKHTVTIWPNPSHHTVHLNTTNHEITYVYHLNGQLLKITNETTIDISNLKSGIYIVKTALSSGEITFNKLIKI